MDVSPGLKTRKEYQTRTRRVAEAARRLFHETPPADPKLLAEWQMMQARQAARDMAEFGRRLSDRKTLAERLLGELILSAAAIALDAMNRGDCERLAGAVERVLNHTGGGR